MKNNLIVFLCQNNVRNVRKDCQDKFVIFLAFNAGQVDCFNQFFRKICSVSLYISV